MPRSFRVFHLIQLAHSALFRAADRRIRDEAGISSSQHAVLAALAAKDGVPITGIAEALNMGKSSLSGLADRMAAKGLIRREVSAQDGRVLNLYLEPRGRELLERSRFLVKHYNQKLLEPFSQAEQQTIRNFLTHIADNAEQVINERPGAAENQRGKQ